MSKPMVSGNRIFLLCVFVVLAAFATQLSSIPKEARAYPLFLLIGSLVIGTWLFISKKKTEVATIDRESVILILLFGILVLAYVLLIDKLSYLVSTLLFLYASQWMLGLKNKVLFIIFPIILTLTIYFLFTRVLGVFLPEGTWIHLYL